jgi:hypothetical protein
MNKSDEKLSEIKRLISGFNQTFESRPRMLGTPENVCAILLVLDDIEAIIKNDRPVDCRETPSWLDFLVEKKLIVGAEDLLVQILRRDEFDFSYLQQLRREFLLWRTKSEL